MLRRHSDRFWTVELKLEGAEKEVKILPQSVV